MAAVLLDDGQSTTSPRPAARRFESSSSIQSHLWPSGSGSFAHRNFGLKPDQEGQVLRGIFSKTRVDSRCTANFTLT